MPIGKPKNKKKSDMRDLTLGNYLSATGAGRGVTAVKELYREATQKKPGEKGYRPANPDKPMGEKHREREQQKARIAEKSARLRGKPKKKTPKKTYHYEYK